MVFGTHECAAQGSYTLKGYISGNTKGKTVLLYTAENANTPIDSTIIRNGKFELKGNSGYPQLLTLWIVDTENRDFVNLQTGKVNYPPVIPVFINEGKVEITALLDSIPNLYKSSSGQYSYDNIQVKGSAIHDAYIDYIQRKKAHTDARNEVFSEYIAYLNPGAGKEKGPVSQGIEIVTRIDQKDAATKAFAQKFVEENNDNILGAYALQDNLSRFSVNEIDELLALISPTIQSSINGRKLAEKAKEIKKTALGSAYADFSFTDNNDNPVKLSDHVGKGKYVLLEFWASWCHPCRADIPHLKEVYELYHPEGFEVISISMDEKKDSWLKAVTDEQMAWLQVSDLKAFKGELNKLYNFNGIPACVLASPDGIIVNRNMRGSWMDKKLIELYGNKFKHEFELSGRITGVDTGIIYLNYSDGGYSFLDRKIVSDSVAIHDGTFLFQGKITCPTTAELRLNPSSQRRNDDPNSVQLWIDPGKMQIEITAGAFKDYKLTGSKTNDESKELDRLRADIIKEMHPISDRLQAEKDHEKAADIREELAPYQEKIVEVEFQFIKTHPDSYISALYLYIRQSSLSLEKAQTLYNTLTKEIKGSSLGKELAQQIQKLKNGSEGSVAAMFSKPADINGTPFDLATLKGEKYILLDFWASWCVPCRKGNPHMKQLYQKYKDDGLAIVCVSDDDSAPDKWRAAVAQDGLEEFHHVLRGLKRTASGFDRSEDINELFGIHALPTKILIDKNGIIIGRYSGNSADLDKQLADIFGE
jgi:thiol-disulfide isomerase/thioredoxin